MCSEYVLYLYISYISIKSQGPGSPCQLGLLLRDPSGTSGLALAPNNHCTPRTIALTITILLHMSCYNRLLIKVLFMLDSRVSSEADGGTTFVGFVGASWGCELFLFVHYTVQVQFVLSEIEYGIKKTDNFE